MYTVPCLQNDYALSATTSVNRILRVINKITQSMQLEDFFNFSFPNAILPETEVNKIDEYLKIRDVKDEWNPQEVEKYSFFHETITNREKKLQDFDLLYNNAKEALENFFTGNTKQSEVVKNSALQDLVSEYEEHNQGEIIDIDYKL